MQRNWKHYSKAGFNSTPIPPIAVYLGFCMKQSFLRNCPWIADTWFGLVQLCPRRNTFFSTCCIYHIMIKACLHLWIFYLNPFYFFSYSRWCSVFDCWSFHWIFGWPWSLPCLHDVDVKLSLGVFPGYAESKLGSFLIPSPGVLENTGELAGGKMLRDGTLFLFLSTWYHQK